MQFFFPNLVREPELRAPIAMPIEEMVVIVVFALSASFFSLNSKTLTNSTCKLLKTPIA